MSLNSHSSDLRSDYHQLARNSLEKLRALHSILKAGFRPDQARVPAGNPDGGQWTDEGGSTRPQRVSGRGGTRGSRTGGRWPEASPGQQTRLAISQFQMRAALEKVRRIDPRWRPTPQAYETIEGQIGANVAVTREAQSRYAELQAKGLVPDGTQWNQYRHEGRAAILRLRSGES